MPAAMKVPIQVSWQAAPALLLRFLLFAALWWALAGAAAWTVGVPVVLFATSASLLLAPARVRWRVRPAVQFALYFIVKSLSAGFDVALRAFARPPRLAPAMIDYPLHLPAGPARVLFAGVVSLVPGSLCAAIENERLCVHVLDVGMPVASELLALEERIGAIFGIEVPPQESSSPV